MPFPEHRPDPLQDDLLDMLLVLSRLPPGSVTSATVDQLVRDTLARNAVLPESLQRRNQTTLVILRRLRQGLYALGAAGIGVSLTAIFTGTVTALAIIAGLASSLVALLVGIIVELAEGQYDRSKDKYSG